MIATVIIGVVSTEPAAKILKPLRDISSPEKEKVIFECEVSRANADVKWFKVLVIQFRIVKKKCVVTYEWNIK